MAQGLLTLIASNLVHDPIVRPFPTFRWVLACSRAVALACTDSGCFADTLCSTHAGRAFRRRCLTRQLRRALFPKPMRRLRPQTRRLHWSPTRLR